MKWIVWSDSAELILCSWEWRQEPPWTEAANLWVSHTKKGELFFFEFFFVSFPVSSKCPCVMPVPSDVIFIVPRSTFPKRISLSAILQCIVKNGASSSVAAYLQMLEGRTVFFNTMLVWLPPGWPLGEIRCWAGWTFTLSTFFMFTCYFLKDCYPSLSIAVLTSWFSPFFLFILFSLPLLSKEHRRLLAGKFTCPWIGNRFHFCV